MPPLTFGDIVGGALHDYDNVHGVDADVDGKRMKLLGDSQLVEQGKATEQGADTMTAAAAAVRAASTRSRRRTRTARARTPSWTATAACSPPRR